ncbi:MAG: hypothetical protein WB870_04595 [Gallionellaceae bacterium]
MKLVWFIFLVVLGCCANLIQARTLEVGPYKEFALPSVAAMFALDGDVIEIDAKGNYINDSAVWKQNNITLKGVNGRPHLRSSGNIPNQKGIWVIQGNHVTVSNVEMSGAKVADKNGAAIRLEGADFHLSDCFIHSNENGILGGNSHPQGEVLIENCEFAFNGDGSGSTHNIYIGDVGRFTLRNSYSHDALRGHLVKSRARENYILYNRLFEGTASYAIDLPNGGYGLVMGNVIYQGPDTDNSTIVAFGAEGLKHPENLLEIAYNSFLNERSSGIFIKTWGESESMVVNNLFSGNGDVVLGAKDKAHIENNIHETKLYEDFSPGNVSLQTGMVPRVVDTAIPVISRHGGQLLPVMQIVRGKVVTRDVLGKGFDIGAVEYR